MIRYPDSIKSLSMENIFFLALVTALLSSCFQTEYAPETILLSSRVQYRIDTSESCWMNERLLLHVPKSIHLDSLRLCVQFDGGEYCDKFLGSYINAYKDTVGLDFLQNGGPYSLVCTTYYNGKVYPESLELDGAGMEHYFPAPESLTFHIGDKALHYVYLKSEKEYVSQDFQTSGIVLRSSASQIQFFGYALDSIVLGGRIPSAPFFASLRNQDGAEDTLDLGSSGRVILPPNEHGFVLHFWRADRNQGCGTLRLGFGPVDTIELPLFEGMIHIPAQPGNAAEWCVHGSCRFL